MNKKFFKLVCVDLSVMKTGLDFQSELEMIRDRLDAEQFSYVRNCPKKDLWQAKRIIGRKMAILESGEAGIKTGNGLPVFSGSRKLCFSYSRDIFILFPSMQTDAPEFSLDAEEVLDARHAHAVAKFFCRQNLFSDTLPEPDSKAITLCWTLFEAFYKLKKINADCMEMPRSLFDSCRYSHEESFEYFADDFCLYSRFIKNSWVSCLFLSSILPEIEFIDLK